MSPSLLRDDAPEAELRAMVTGIGMKTRQTAPIVTPPANP